MFAEKRREGTLVHTAHWPEQAPASMWTSLASWQYFLWLAGSQHQHPGVDILPIKCVAISCFLRFAKCVWSAYFGSKIDVGNFILGKIDRNILHVAKKLSQNQKLIFSFVRISPPESSSSLTLLESPRPTKILSNHLVSLHQQILGAITTSDKNDDNVRSTFFLHSFFVE